jgi:hypothetical protein
MFDVMRALRSLKGRASHYWSARVSDTTVKDLAWSYDFPDRSLTPITNLVAYNEDTDLTVNGRLIGRPDPAGQRVSEPPPLSQNLYRRAARVLLPT